MNRPLFPMLAAACLLGACAAAPQMPPEVDLRHAAIMADAAEPALLIDGPSGKAAGAGKDAAKGGGAGFLVSGWACAAAGPLAPLCFITVVPASMAVGAVGGAIIGAVRSESAAGVDEKRSLLQTQLAASAATEQLVAHLQKQSREAAQFELPLAPTVAGAALAKWTLQIALTELATVGSGPDTPYALQASAQMKVVRSGEAQPVFAKQYQSVSAATLKTADWRADEAAPVRHAIDDMSAALAAQMLGDLMQTRR